MRLLIVGILFLITVRLEDQGVKPDIQVEDLIPYSEGRDDDQGELRASYS